MTQPNLNSAAHLFRKSETFVKAAKWSVGKKLNALA